ncbi:hypothetical protein AB0M12_23320 [Nocardia vinacea]|uniref:hypothetical protein n=1 Tax=Nocardia vinacea TaxID=96468 RepID=UPI003413F78A
MGWSRGGLAGYVVAEDGELGDVVAEFSFGVDATGVVLGAEVSEADGRLGQQVPHDDKDGTGHGDKRFDLAAAFDQATVAFTEEGVGLRG